MHEAKPMTILKYELNGVSITWVCFRDVGNPLSYRCHDRKVSVLSGSFGNYKSQQ